MTVGISVTLANALVGTVAGYSFVAPVTTRQRAYFAVPALGAIALALSPPPWLMTGDETISHLSVWSAPTGGTCYFDVVVAVPQSVHNGDTLTLNILGLSLGPIST